MAAYGVQIFKDNGDVWWDSRTVLGGIVTDVLVFGSGESGSKAYPAFPGRSVRIVHLPGYSALTAMGITTSTAAGYPTVNVATAGGVRQFLVVIF